MKTLDLLKQLSEAPGPSGREDTGDAAICAVTRALWEPLADDLRTDALGNLIARQDGSGDAPRPAVMLAAHMDEIGLIVTGIEGQFLRVHALGGTDRRILLGQEVMVHGRRELPGVIGTRPPHVLTAAERKKIVPWDELFVDVGLPAAEVAAQVRVGDHITFRQDLVELKNRRVAGKALDNRAAVAILTLALDALRRREHAWDVYAVATVQEEVGIKGAITSAYGLAPDLAVAVDMTFAQQHDDGSNEIFEMDKGPTISVGPNLHPQVVARLKSAANALEIPYQIEPVPGHSGTDAWGIQVAREGIPCGLVGIPVRYMHQPVETASLADIERAGRLLAHFIAELAADYRPQWEDEAE